MLEGSRYATPLVYFLCPPTPPQMHINFHSLRVWKTLGTSNRCSCSLANTLPPPRPPFAPRSSSPLRHSQDLGSEKEGWAKGLLRSLHGAGAAVFLSPRLGGFVPISCFQLLSCQFCSARLSLPFTVNFGGKSSLHSLLFLTTHTALSSGGAGEISCLPLLLTAQTAKIEPFLWF